MNDDMEKAAEDPVLQAVRNPTQRRRVKVADILADQREAILEHNGQDYLLRITANGRLILTK